jgi:peroxiredoxin family protein
MMDMIVLCREGVFDSLVTTIAVAMTAQRSGKEVGVVFTGDALNRVCTGVVRWARSLSSMEVRKTISKEAKEMGLSLASSSDPRELDLQPLLKEARDAGVKLYACPLWSRLLKLTNTLPEWLSEIEMDRFVEEIISSPKVVGSL